MFIISIDIGGTKVCGGIVQKIADKNWQCIKYIQEPTKKGKQNLFQQVKSIVNRLKNDHTNLINLIIGMPGYFPKNVISPGSAKQLGMYEKEFDNLNVLDFFQAILSDKDKTFVINDAKLQSIGAFFQHKKNEQISNKALNTVMYIGIGTGLGGSVINFKLDSIHFLTDGQISNIILKHCNQEAETLLSSYYISNFTNHSALEISENKNLLSKYEHIFTNMGNNLAELIIQIKQQKVHRKNELQSWHLKDIELLSEINMFLIGGGIGQKGVLSDLIIQKAKKILKNKGYNDCCLVPIQKSARTALVAGGYFFEYCC